MEPLLQVEAVQEVLSNALIGHRIDYYHSVGSTMDIARQAAEESAAEGTVIVAEEQTAGRGRFGRKWVTAPGQNLSFSVVLYPGQMGYFTFKYCGCRGSCKSDSPCVRVIAWDQMAQ